MDDHGLLFKIGDDFGASVRVPIQDVETLIGHLGAAPGGPEGSPSAFEARDLLQAALDRADEVRHWVISDQAAGEICWSLDRAAPVSEPLRDLRAELGDYLDRKEDAA